MLLLFSQFLSVGQNRPDRLVSGNPSRRDFQEFLHIKARA
jgi:hypothetical protein